MGHDAQLLDLAVVAGVGHGGLQILVHTVDGDTVLGELGGDGGQHARLVVDQEAHGECSLGGGNRSLRQILVQRDGRAGAASSNVAGFGHHVAHDGGGGRSAAGATAVEHEVVGGLGLDEHGVEGAVHGGQRVVLVNQGRVDAGGDAGLAVLDHGEQLDDLVLGGGCGDVVGGDLGDAFDGHIVDGHGGVEAEGGHDGGLVGSIVAFDVAGRVGFGVALGLGVLEHVVKLETLGGHLVENVVGGAVDDAEHAGHLVADQGLAQRAQERNRATHSGLEVDVDALGLGGGVDLRAVLGQQRLVGGDHGSTGFDGGKHELAGHGGAADELDDDVRVGGHAQSIGGDDGLVDPRELLGFLRVEAGDAGQFDRAADTSGQFVLLLDNQAGGLGADGAGTKQAYANRGFVVASQFRVLPKSFLYPTAILRIISDSRPKVLIKADGPFRIMTDLAAHYRLSGARLCTWITR